MAKETNHMLGLKCHVHLPDKFIYWILAPHLIMSLNVQNGIDQNLYHRMYHIFGKAQIKNIKIMLDYLKLNQLSSEIEKIAKGLDDNLENQFWLNVATNHPEYSELTELQRQVQTFLLENN